jgi:hypothetical protein
MNDGASQGQVPYERMLNRAQNNLKPMPPERAADDLDVPRGLGRINKALAELHATLDVLTKRLHPVMSEQTTADDRPNPSSRCELGERLVDTESSVLNAAERVSDVIDRLQL